MASLGRPPPRSRATEASENDPDGPLDAAPLPPPRGPLLCIPDPSQSPRKRLVCELDVPKVDHSQLCAKGAGGTPRSAQSTPTRALSRVHGTNGVLCSGNGGRLPLHGGGREKGSSSRAVRAMADVKSCPSAEPEVRHFELDEDPSFWNDHNVQVLIRIRPINNTESASEGHGRCLRQESSQTLTWTGHPETRFTFDHVACETISQAKLFRVVGVPMVENCMSGYHSCMFAYGQTGSGKTHTMMGEIWETDSNPCEDRGMTPRIFEYMFARIREEEENRKDDNLKYSCRCSYLEIYNEQITDLLDPSSTNLQLREDLNKGVYVENLKERDVTTVKDVIELLLQGMANRKMAATSMNSESSRSHSVFTCSIESQWDNDSMRRFRFGRLNLVDLAGSERQKSSGAEGERLKEAANINRSLSTLGLVIMTLVDIANGKHRHVPYRDSRLTFLLQDSLGGNSKTTIIANVSPSICSANETLSTLKFAQRAKLIQNNAKVNEDASGDVMALQREIQILKDQLNIVIKHQNVPRPLFSPLLPYETANVGIVHDDCGSSAGSPTIECSSFLDRKMTFLESALAGTLRREKMAEAEVSRLEAENEHMKQLVMQMEADVQQTKMMLHLRDETIRRLELQKDGLASANEYVMEKNSTLTREIQMLQDKIDTNPESTQFSMENIKLLEQLRVLQDFYQKGEHEILLNENSELQNERLNALEGKCEQATLTCERELQVMDYTDGESQMMSEAGPLPVECMLVDNVMGDRMVMQDEVTSKEETDEISECDTSESSLHAKKFQEEAEAMRNLDVQFQNEHHLQVSQFYEMERIREQVEVETAQTILNLQEELAAVQQELYSRRANGFLDEESSIVLRKENQELKEKLLQVTKKNTELLDSINANDTQINVMADEWEKAVIELTSFLLDGCESLEYASDHINNIIDSFPQSKSWISDHVQRAMKVFVEREKLIVSLKKSLEDAQKMGLEMTSKLNSLKGATMAITEIQQLEHDETTNEMLYLQTLLDEKTSMIQKLESIIKCKDDRVIKAEKQANAAFIALKRLNEMTTKGSLHARAKEQMFNGTVAAHPQYLSNQSKDCQPGRSELQAPSSDTFKAQIEGRVPESKLLPSKEQQKTIISQGTKFEEDVLLKEIHVYIEDAVKQVLESENELVACCTDTQNSLAFLASETNDMYSSAMSFLRQMVAEIGFMKKYFAEVVEGGMQFLPSIDTTSVYEAQCTKPMGPCLMMQLIENDLPRANGRLRALNVEFERLFGIYRHIIEHKNSSKKGANFMPCCEDNLLLNKSEILHLGDGLKFSFDSLSAVNDQLTMLLDGIGGNKNSSAENNSSEMVEIGSNVFSQNALSQLDHTLQVLEQRITETDANCTRTREMLHLNLNDGWRIANEKTRQAASLFLKFEEAQETMKEADRILIELMSANETARLETERWKRATQVMQVESASLAAEVEQMRDAIVVDAKQNQILIAEVNATITEMPKLLSELEQMFQIMQNHSKSELKAIYYDILSFAMEMRECVRVSTIWSETLFRKIIREKLPSCTLQQDQEIHEVGSCGLDMNPVISWEVEEGKTGLEAECNLSQQVLNTFQKSLADIVSNYDTGNYERVNAICDLKDMLLQIAKLEKGEADLINDMNLVKGAIFNKIMLLDQVTTFAKNVSLQHQSFGCIGSHFGNECTTVNALVDRYQGCDATTLSDSSVSSMHPKLQLHIIHDVQGVPRNDDAPRQAEEEGTIIDMHVLLSSIQQLRAHCDKLMLVMEKKINSKFTISNDKDAMVISAVIKDSTKTQHGSQLMQAVDKLGTGLVWLVGLLRSELDTEVGMDTFPSLFEMLSQGICNLEEKAHKLIERQSSDGIEQSNNLANILSVQWDQAPEHVQGVQESISTDKGIKHEGERIPDDLNNVHDKLAIKITQVDAILRHQKELDSQLADRESAFSSLRSELKDTKCALSMLAKENEKLVLLLEDVNREKMDAEEQLKDKEKLIMNLKQEILCLNASVEERVFSSVEEIAEELRLVSDEKDQLHKELVHLNEKLDMTSALADENEAVAIEARQDAEASKVYAEEKEQEVKVLENSVEELEDTVNMLEKKVYDMGEEVERYRLIREDLQLELQTLRERVFTTEHTSENFDIEDYMVEVQHGPRQVDDILQELSVSKKRIKDLENERARQAEEIKQHKQHISEIILHSEAQSSLYHQKFQALEAMAYEVKTCPSISNHTSSVTNKTDKSSFRQRGSGSPFRCISSLVQQMNSEKDQELSMAKHRIEELEVLASDRQKQVCMLSARLAAVDNMTHDVIRDLLEVKLDMTNYANLVDLKELHKLVQNGLQKNDQSRRKDEEILRLKAQINALTEEKDSWIEGRKADILATQEKLEKLQYQDQLLTAQNEMLKLDKANLTKRLTELDEVIKNIVGSQSIQELIQPLNVKESIISRQNNNKLARRLAESDKLLLRAKNEPAWSSPCHSSEPFHQQQ